MIDSVDLWNFVWWVPDQGYVWQDDADAQNEKPPFLVRHPKAEVENHYVPIRFDEPGNEGEKLLFDSFARLEPTPDDILAFANQWGWLGVREPIIVRSKKGKPPQ